MSYSSKIEIAIGIEIAIAIGIGIAIAIGIGIEIGIGIAIGIEIEAPMSREDGLPGAKGLLHVVKTKTGTSQRGPNKRLALGSELDLD